MLLMLIFLEKLSIEIIEFILFVNLEIKYRLYDKSNGEMAEIKTVPLYDTLISISPLIKI